MKIRWNPKCDGNMVIHGDNLLALKSLESDYKGHVKCVCIDPPYNTGSAFNHYEDGLEHSLWLSLMRDRLVLLHKLLSEDGVFFCFCDSNEVAYLGVLLDEIFGRANKIELMIWKKSYGGGAKSKYIVNQHEYIYCYGKNTSQTPLFFLPPDPEAVKKYYKFNDEYFSQLGPYRIQPLATNSMDERPNLRYPIPDKDGSEIWPEKQWQWGKERALRALEENKLVINKKNGKTVISYKQYLKDESGQERKQKPKSIIEGFYTQHGTKESVALFGEKNKFSFPKPEGLIHYLLESCTNKGDLVLDSFVGSGTTAAVAHKMGRRYIVIELGDHCFSHVIPRLQRVVSGEDQGGISKDFEWKGGGGFNFFSLAPSLLQKDDRGNWVIVERESK